MYGVNAFEAGSPVPVSTWISTHCACMFLTIPRYQGTCSWEYVYLSALAKLSAADFVVYVQLFWPKLGQIASRMLDTSLDVQDMALLWPQNRVWDQWWNWSWDLNRSRLASTWSMMDVRYRGDHAKHFCHDACEDHDINICLWCSPQLVIKLYKTA